MFGYHVSYVIYRGSGQVTFGSSTVQLPGPMTDELLKAFRAKLEEMDPGSQIVINTFSPFAPSAGHACPTCGLPPNRR